MRRLALALVLLAGCPQYVSFIDVTVGQGGAGGIAGDAGADVEQLGEAGPEAGEGGCELCDGGTCQDGGCAPTCSTCSQALDGPPQLPPCAASATLFGYLLTCACDQGPCAADCYGSLCSGAAIDPGCRTCLLSKCASSFAQCSNDKSTAP